MSDLRKVAEAKKAAIHADAEKRAAEIDREMAELERLTAKYGLSVAPVPSAEEPADQILQSALNDAIQSVADVLATLADASVTAKAKAASEAYIRMKNRPVPLGELHEMLEQHGIRFTGDTSRNSLSAILSQTPSLYSISRDKGWWLKDVPVPAMSLFRRI